VVVYAGMRGDHPVAEEIEFVVNGQAFKLTHSRVTEVMAGVAPEPIRSHYVSVGGMDYPVKQVLELATGLDRLDFTSAAARRNLARLGFQLHRAAP
jgi:hypothetical protein